MSRQLQLTTYNLVSITRFHSSIETTMATPPMDSRLDISSPKMPTRSQFPGICFTNRCAVLSDDPSRKLTAWLLAPGLSTPRLRTDSEEDAVRFGAR